MTSTFSGHLLESYYSFHQSRAPFGEPIHNSQLRLSGAMSFSPQMHGNFPSNPQFSEQNISMAGMSSMDTSFMSMSEETGIKIQRLQEKLQKKLGPEYISQRPGPGGGQKLTYAEGWKIINLANEVFGFNGWSSSIVNLNTDFVDFSEESRRYNVGVSAVVRITLRDGVYHEDVGYGMLENSRSKGAALDKCKKEAVTDAVKRALRNFGNLLGNCLYDKSYTQEVVKIKIPPPKFNKSELHRRPEFDDSNQSGPATATPSSSTLDSPKPINNIPNANTNGGRPTYARPNATSAPARPNIPPPQNVKNGLNTPAQTPMQRSGQNGMAVPRSLNAPKPIIPIPPQRMGMQPPPRPAQPAQPTQKQLAPGTSGPTAPRPAPLQQTGAKSLEETASQNYSLNSDDDAFFASLDLGEGEMRLFDEIEADVGRPIEAEDGEGGTIDIDEGKRTPGDEVTSSAETKVSSSDVGSDTGSKQQSMQARQQQRPSMPPPNQNHVRFEAIKSALGEQQSEPQPQRAERSTPLQKAPSIPSINLNVVAPADGAQNNTPSIRARPPSLGGFNFPPGVTPAGMPSVNINRSQSMAIPGHLGMKRNADMMGLSHARGPGIGMGLSRTTNEGQQTRQPLAPLDLDGNDVKRIRR